MKIDGRRVSARRTVGYLVLCDGHPYRDAPASTYRRSEIGRLFYPGTYTTVWSTHRAARAAMRRSIKAWGRDDKEARRWDVLALRRPRS